MNLILASKSRARQNLLRAAGLDFTAHPADVDEDAITNRAFKKNTPPADIAHMLAAAKALHIAKQNPDALVIGGDQILECEGSLLTKAKDKNEAREKLKMLRGKTHHLISAIVVAQNEKTLWQATQSASLTMHNFSDDFLEEYLEKAGPALTRSVGAYELESIGVQLFEKIEGDYFTILGLPLLPLLRYLQTEQGMTL